MLLEKLSTKAAAIFKSLPKSKKTFSIKKIIDQIVESDGLGTKIVQNNKLDLNNRKTISIDLLLKESYFQASLLEHPFVGTEHILLAILKIVKSSNYDKILDEVTSLSVFSKNIKNVGDSTRTLNNPFTKDLTLYYLKNPQLKLIDRDICKHLITSLMTKDSSGVLLVGENGVGRQSLINLLAYKTANLDIPVPLISHKVLEVDFLEFMVSIISRASFEAGINALVSSITRYTNNKAIVYVKNLENIFMPSSNGISVPLAFNLFKDILNENDIKIIAKISTDTYDKLSAEHENSISNFSIIEVSEPSNADVKNILKNYSFQLEKYHNVQINDSVIDYALKSADITMPEYLNPKKSIVLLDLACSLVNYNKNIVDEKYQQLMNKSINLITDIHKNIDFQKYDSANKQRLELIKTESNIDSIEEENLNNSKPFTITTKDIDYLVQNYFSNNKVKNNKDLVKLSNLNKKILKKIVGQDEAVNKTVKALIRSSLGLKSKKRPMGNFLFLGPTGVGKTELAKVLATSFFGQNSLIRLDMSDFGEKHNVARLIGAPPGYIGYGDGGELTSKIAANPSSIVLFDEIEKAHPDVLNILLQILDEGELKDSKGNTFKFNNAVIILTSNAGTNIVHNTNIGFTKSDIEHSELTKRLKINLKKIMKPELLNRFDEIIIFKQLTKDDQLKILDLLIKDITQNLAKQKVTLKVTKKVREFILDKGYSKEFGVRALRRILEVELLDKVADYLLNNYKKPLEIKASMKKDQISIN